MDDDQGYNVDMPTSPEMPAIIKRRRPRFERVKNLSFQLTDRDCEITLFVGMGRFRSSRQIRAMFGGSYHVLHRLQALYHASILDRPQAQKEIFVKGGGSGSHIYALAPKGARLLNERYGTQFPDIDWLHANREVGRPHNPPRPRHRRPGRRRALSRALTQRHRTDRREDAHRRLQDPARIAASALHVETDHPSR